MKILNYKAEIARMNCKIIPNYMMATRNTLGILKKMTKIKRRKET